MIMYKISSYGFQIKPVEVVRKSESSVWLMHNNKERRESNCYYFETWEAAKEEIVSRYQRYLREAMRQLDRAERDLAEAMLIKYDEKLK